MSLFIACALVGFALGLMKHSLVKTQRELAELKAQFSGSSSAHQDMISNLYCLRVDDANERSALKNRIEMLEYRTGREGGIHGSIEAIWGRLEEIKSSHVEAGVSE